MAGRSFSPSEKATAIALARMTSVDTAAATLIIDRRTLRGWVAAAPPATDEDAWRAAEALAQQQLLTSLATGKVKQPNILAVVAGIAGDKVWRRRRYDERQGTADDDAGDTIEARRQAIIAKLEPWQPDTPESHRRHRYVYECRERLMAFIDRQDDPEAGEVWRDTPDPGPEHAAGIRFLNLRVNPGAPPDLSDADWEAVYARLLADVQAAADAWWPDHCAELQARAYIDRTPTGRIRIRPDGERITIELPPGSALPAEYAGATVFAVSLPSAAQDVSPRPELPYQPPLQEAPRPDDHDHPSWRRLR